jgi:hypothetical protein
MTPALEMLNVFVPGVVVSDIPTLPEATFNVSEKPLACMFD